MRFKTETNAPRSAGTVPAQAPDDCQTSGLFRSASRGVDIRELLAAGAVLRELMPSYMDTLRLHPMARTASFGLFQNRVLVASRRLAAATDGEYKALESKVINLANEIRGKSTYEEKKALYDEDKSQNLIGSWMVRAIAPMINNVLKRYYLDGGDEASSLASQAAVDVIRPYGLGLRTKKDPLHYFISHEHRPGDTILTSLLGYMKSAANSTAMEYKKYRDREGKRVDLQPKVGDQFGIEDMAADRRTPETEAIRAEEANGTISDKVERLEKLFDAQKKEFEKEAVRQIDTKDVVQISERKQYIFNYTTRMKYLVPKLREMRQIADRSDDVYDDILLERSRGGSTAEKQARTKELLAEYESLNSQYKSIYDEFEQAEEQQDDIKSKTYFDRENDEKLAYQRAEKAKRLVDKKQNMGITPDAVMDDIDPQAAALAESKKNRKQDVLKGRTGKVLATPLDKKIATDAAWKLADQIVPHIFWSSKYPENNDISRDPRSSRLHKEIEFESIIPNKKALESALSPDPSIRATAPAGLLATIALWKSLVVMNQMNNFDEEYAVGGEVKASADVRMRKLMSEGVDRDAVLSAHAGDIRDAVGNMKISPDVYKKIDFKLRSGTYDWAKNTVAAGVPWKTLSPSQNDQIAQLVFETLYSGEKNTMTFGNADAGEMPVGGGSKITFRSSKTPDPITPEARRQIIDLELQRIHDYANGINPTAWGHWGAKINEASEMSGSELNYKKKKRFNGDGQPEGIGVPPAPLPGVDDVVEWDDDFATAPPVPRESAPAIPIGGEIDEPEEEISVASRIDRLVRVGARLENQGRGHDAARVARVVARLFA